MALAAGNGGVLELARLRWLGGALAVGGIAGLAWWLSSRGDTPGDIAYPIPGERFAYTVEVLNGTGVDGLARDVTQRLRRRGVDVVFFGSAPDPVDSTLVIVRRGDPEAGEAVRAVLGLGRVVVELDPRLLLDVTIVLGPDAVPGRDP
jgi:hypothetical protein